MRAIAIDGPAGAGKSSLAKRLAGELGYIYIDTGAMYRAAALWADREGMAFDNETEIISRIDNLIIDVRYTDGSQRIYLNNEDVSELIRTPRISQGASAIAVLGAVREKLVMLQRELATRADVIMDGRDIGTHVLPDADLKLYLFASAEDRAQRRYLEFKQNGVNDADYMSVLEEIKVRDYRDMNREISPLRQAEDAVVFDNSGLEPDETYIAIRGIIKEKLGV